MNGYFLVIDGSSLLFTQYYGNLPREILFEKDEEKKKKYYHRIMMTSKGVYTNAVYGFLRYLFRVLKTVPPTHLVVNWDISRTTFRTEMYPEYKSNRSSMPEPLGVQFDLCQEVLSKMGIMQLMSETYEADDFSGTVSKRFEDQIPVRIISKDRDYLQLVSDKTELWIMSSSVQKTEELFKKYNMDPKDYVVAERCFPLTPELVEKEYGVSPSSVPSLKGLMGDPSDNIKGVPGIGEKAAMALISKYKTIDGLYSFIGQPDDARKAEINALWKTELGLARSPLAYLLKDEEGTLSGEKAARLCEKIATIKRDVPLEKDNLSDYELHFNADGAREALKELEMNSLLDDIPAPKTEAVEIKQTIISDLATASGFFAKKPETQGFAGFLESADDQGEYIALSLQDDSVFIFRPDGILTLDYVKDELCKALGKGLKLSVFNIKENSFASKRLNAGNSFDPVLAAYLLDPLKNEYTVKSVAFDYAPGYAGVSEAVLARILAGKLEQLLEKKELKKLYYEMELPLTF
ncbi:MAG: hypothetical protein J6U10_03750, partial [Lachnospiraceae bacterium]|nr:hypothetical protein [Lachnospiraceae bacterium]